ncbi:UNVERIFIED_CONTAM: hypothetical protein GTU68_041676 [Idotea baltica]|nr:hypothetical protein [Idotea baltica]
MAQPFHFAHLSTFARGKAGLVFAEATAVAPEGRITPQCLGIWTDEQAAAIKPIVDFIKSMGAVPGIQLAHAGPPDEPDGWQCVGPSAVAAGPNFPTPTELSIDDIKALVDAFVAAAKRSIDCGFQIIELHGAHGYLMNSFLSPLSNHRTDEYGGDINGRMRFPLEVANAVRLVVGEDMPLFFRISAVDSVDGGWNMDDSVTLAHELGKAGIDVVDCSAGKPLTKSSARAPGFQVPYAERIKKETTVKSMAVGVIIDPHQAEDIISQGQADIVALGREIMYNPFWPLHAAQALEADPEFNLWPPQYKWAVDRRQQIRQLNK